MRGGWPGPTPVAGSVLWGSGKAGEHEGRTRSRWDEEGAPAGGQGETGGHPFDNEWNGNKEARRRCEREMKSVRVSHVGLLWPRPSSTSARPSGRASWRQTGAAGSWPPPPPASGLGCCSSQMSTYSSRSGLGTALSGTCFTRLNRRRASSIRHARTCAAAWGGARRGAGRAQRGAGSTAGHGLGRRRAAAAAPSARLPGKSDAAPPCASASLARQRRPPCLPRAPAAQTPPGSAWWGRTARRTFPQRLG